MARPSKLTPKLRERIVHELADGVPVNVTAQRVGIAPRTLHSWLADGRVVRREQPDPLLVETTTPPAAPDLDERLADVEPGLVSVILSAARRGSWQAALAVLERRFPERWARQSRQPPATPPPSRSEESQQVDELFAAMDELAARRAPRSARMQR